MTNPTTALFGADVPTTSAPAPSPTAQARMTGAETKAHNAANVHRESLSTHEEQTAATLARADFAVALRIATGDDRRSQQGTADYAAGLLGREAVTAAYWIEARGKLGGEAAGEAVGVAKVPVSHARVTLPKGVL